MTALMRIVGLATGQPSPFDGQWLAEYDPTRPGIDPNGRPMTAHIATTTDPAKAMRFGSYAAAHETWTATTGRTCPGAGRPHPDRPLTAFTIEVVPAAHHRTREAATVNPRPTIPEDMIMQHLGLLLNHSEPGATIHHLAVIAAPPGAVGPLGQADKTQLKSTIYVIAPDQRVNVEEFISKVVMAAAVNSADEGTVPLFAALSQEGWTVHPMDDLGLSLAREGRLYEHPNVVEVTLVYGASCDGRRWRGRRWLTGPKAGTTEHVDLLVGRPHPHEGYGVTGAPLLRRLVGTA